jgi:kinesin family protein 5
LRPKTDTIKVVIRIRPLNDKEIAINGNNTDLCVKAFPKDPTLIESIVQGEKKQFSFDRVYFLDAKQSEIFDITAKKIIDDVFGGFNGTIFAYGQTGSGKSHTMMGPDI